MKSTFRFLVTLVVLATFYSQVADVSASESSMGPETVSESSDTAKHEGQGKIDSVVLYRQQALVSRIVSLPEAGKEEGSLGQFTVTGLPPSVIPNTLFAEGFGQVQIQGVRFETAAVRVSPNSEIKELNQKIKAVNEKIALANARQQLVAQRKAYLDKMEGFVAGTGKVEMSKGVLDAETLERMFSFTTKERSNLMNDSLSIKKELQEQQSQLIFLKRKLAEKSTAESKTVRQAIIYYRRAEKKASNLRLSYLVNQCGWSPSYSVRAEENVKELDLEYNGMIRQFTGEDWKDVALTLSTASPAMSAASPGIAPFRISLARGSVPQVQQLSQSRRKTGGRPGNGPTGGGFGGGGYPGQSFEMNQRQVAMILQEQSKQMIANGNAVNYVDNLKSSFAINDSANKLSEIALNWDADDIQSAFSQATDSEESLSLNYELNNEVTLSSRNGQQMVTISKSKLKQDLYYVASPILTRQVFREAEITNTSKHDFLSGPVTVYLNNRYVGRAELATVARGQSFVVGLGTDPQIRTSRRIVSRKQKTQGGNRVIDLKFVTVVENFKDKKVPIRIYDRIPNSKLSSQVKVSTHEMKNPLSSDSNYQKIEKPLGILRWDIDIAASSNGEKSFEIPFGYSIEHDRNYMVTTKVRDNDGLKQFDELQRKRNRK